ncbi:hypothetical protein F5050DRAFT_1709866 [Lentinula boryana]|uniref:MIP18 family-like domain-containing protein n=1 Tax=Lentinula boryana TaxID=40481 RepID=A0ABQ8QLC0_9AGAR|nr:hypothetical protein F5050DRAFT_1709866 [Lentinula boryana]
MSGEIFNPNPTVFRSSTKSHSPRRLLAAKKSLWINEYEASQLVQVVDDEEEEAIDQDEIFGAPLFFYQIGYQVDEFPCSDLIKNIYDPEHPNTLEELHVVSAPQIDIVENRVEVEFTPTVPHCGMSTLIGLSIRVRLIRSLPTRFKLDIVVKPGSHQSEHAVNKQLNDKERVAAALENPALPYSLSYAFRSLALNVQFRLITPQMCSGKNLPASTKKLRHLNILLPTPSRHAWP